MSSWQRDITIIGFTDVRCFGEPGLNLIAHDGFSFCDPKTWQGNEIGSSFF